MGSFALDFSAYNALLSSNGYGGSYYGADDVFLGGGDPGLSLLTNVGRRHLQNVHNQQQLHLLQQQQQQQGRDGPAPPGSHAAAAAAAGHHSHHQVNNRYRVQDRNSLARLEAEKTLQDRRKLHIANFGATWLKPPGVSKTLFQIREECRELEEQAEAERREELAQQLVQAEAAAALEAEEAAEQGTGWGAEEGEEEGGQGEEEEDGDIAAAAGQDEMEADALAEEEGELDLDDEIPDADAEDFSFGNNDDGSDDPFASSEEEDPDSEDAEYDDAGEEDEEVDEGPDEDAYQRAYDEDHDLEDDGRPREESIMLGEQAAISAPLSPFVGRSSGSARRYRVSGERDRTAAVSPFAGLSGAAPPFAFATPVHPAAATIEDRREQVRARAAERRETRQIRATEDRMRAMLMQPRLSGLGGVTGGMGVLYGDEDDLDEDDQAQMLQEEDLVQGGVGRAVASRGDSSNNNGRRSNRMVRSSLGAGSVVAGNADDGGADSDGGNYYTSSGRAGAGDYGHDASGLEMDMDADLDEDVPEGSSPIAAAMDMNLSAYDESGYYEHTDTEAELSSSVYDGDRGVDTHAQLSRHRRERSGIDVDDDDDDDEGDMGFHVSGGLAGHMSGGGGGDGAYFEGHARGNHGRHDVDLDNADDVPHHSFLASGLTTSGSLHYGRTASRTGRLGMADGSSGGGNGGTGGQRFRGSLGQSDRNSLDISGLLSRDGSSNVGSSPQVRWH